MAGGESVTPAQPPASSERGHSAFGHKAGTTRPRILFQRDRAGSSIRASVCAVDPQHEEAPSKLVKDHA